MPMRLVGGVMFDRAAVRRIGLDCSRYLFLLFLAQLFKDKARIGGLNEFLCHVLIFNYLGQIGQDADMFI